MLSGSLEDRPMKRMMFAATAFCCVTMAPLASAQPPATQSTVVDTDPGMLTPHARPTRIPFTASTASSS
jgi:hypothetical protein